MGADWFLPLRDVTLPNLPSYREGISRQPVCRLGMGADDNTFASPRQHVMLNLVRNLWIIDPEINSG